MMRGNCERVRRSIRSFFNEYFVMNCSHEMTGFTLAMKFSVYSNSGKTVAAISSPGERPLSPALGEKAGVSGLCPICGYEIG